MISDRPTLSRWLDRAGIDPKECHPEMQEFLRGLDQLWLAGHRPDRVAEMKVNSDGKRVLGGIREFIKSNAPVLSDD